MPNKHEITAADILPMDVYGRERAERRKRMTEIKRNRRVAVGPDATFYFESFDTMFHQVHEMLFIEKGGADQVPDELAAYNPLIPKGRELVATLMFEIDDPVRRAQFLNGLGGIEETVTFEFAGETVKGVPEADIDRTTADGKASSVQFLHFPFTDAQAAKFKDAGTQVQLQIAHEKYGHIAILPGAVKDALAGDFD
ncbi:MAG TPA: DUF3501 domain-containing protein [Rhodospirillaceae bacterium]|nr:hypothetical protein [Magnetovibrio sp.]HBT40488.1 DUF3501 domain-containing protein [Rhodospirillaceae bacterium]HCS69647.1 DUF3501 domain-containing protein [Rhodospirillaceae bacterium]|tara:strand:+ start:2081 stop:2671 length:591 start_codon:yes stop_codon:yes gene_type:complete